MNLKFGQSLVVGEKNLSLIVHLSKMCCWVTCRCSLFKCPFLSMSTECLLDYAVTEQFWNFVGIHRRVFHAL